MSKGRAAPVGRRRSAEVFRVPPPTARKHLHPAKTWYIMSGPINSISGCSAAGSALGLGPRCRGFKSLHSDHFRIGVDTFVSTPIFCIIDLLLPRKMMLYDPHFHVSKKIVCEIRKTCTRWGFRLKDKKEIVCEMGRPPLSGKLRLDFSAFLSIAILQAERLERRI